MREQVIDMWQVHEQKKYVCITVNRFVKRDGKLVMGRGCAKEARDRYPDIAKRLGTVYWQNIREKYAPVIVLADLKLISFPVKEHFMSPAKLDIVENSCRELMKVIEIRNIKEVYLPRPGCGVGRLDWGRVVKPVISKILDDRVIVITKG